MQYLCMYQLHILFVKKILLTHAIFTHAQCTLPIGTILPTHIYTRTMYLRLLVVARPLNILSVHAISFSSLCHTERLNSILSSTKDKIHFPLSVSHPNASTNDILNWIELENKNNQGEKHKVNAEIN